MQGKDEYVKFKNFIEWAGIPTINIALKFLKRRKMAGDITGGRKNKLTLQYPSEK